MASTPAGPASPSTGSGVSLAPRKYVISGSHSRRVSRLQAPSFICGIGVIRYFPHGSSGRLCKITAEDVIANGRFLVALAPGRAAGTVSTWSRNKLFCDPGAGGLSCAARFAGVRQGQGRALRGLPGRRPQEGSERSPAARPAFEARPAASHRCLSYQETLPQSWHLCHTGRLRNAVFGNTNV